MSLMANLRRSSLTKRSGAPSPSIGCCAWHPCARLSTSTVYRSNISGSNFARPLFPAALRDARCQLREHGAAAGFLLRSRALAEDLLPDVYGLAKETKNDAALLPSHLRVSGALYPAQSRYEERQRRGRRARDLQHRPGQTRDVARDGEDEACVVLSITGGVNTRIFPDGLSWCCGQIVPIRALQVCQRVKLRRNARRDAFNYQASNYI